MKKMVAFMMVLALACSNVPAHLGYANGKEAVYAAESVAIASADDLLAMEQNPGRNYYLSKDITVSAGTKLFQDRNTPFKGTLDGKGHKINGLRGGALIGQAQNAKFQNLTLADVTLSEEAALVNQARKCTFTKIKVSGKATGSSAGLVNSASDSTFTDCSSSVAFSIKNKKSAYNASDQSAAAAGIVLYGSGCKLKNCKNTGSFSLEAVMVYPTSVKAYGIAGSAQSLENCKNSGNIAVKGTKPSDPDDGYYTDVHAAGIAGSYTTLKNCGNSGKIVASCTSVESGMRVSGVALSGTNSGKTHNSVARCYNKGAVSATGKCGRGIKISGVTNETEAATECYNTGKISVDLKSQENVIVGGICSSTTFVQNCYNTGNVTLKGSGFAGGIAGIGAFLNSSKKKDAMYNYNCGTVKASGKNSFAGAIFGELDGADDIGRPNARENYYTSGKPYGHETTAWKPYMAKATKVSSITSRNCPKLSSKYWTYSSKHKRMILKNNKE